MYLGWYRYLGNRFLIYVHVVLKLRKGLSTRSVSLEAAHRIDV